jgi:ribosomal protein S18 acetylase RimI-like enzyme
VETCTLRTAPTPKDVSDVRKIIAATGFFSYEEITTAGGLIEEALLKGDEAGYHFIFAENRGTLFGYCCFGPIPLTQQSFDLYWIAVLPAHQGSGLGRRLMQAAETAIRDRGGRQIYADTSSRAQYLPTRTFYESLGYRQAAYLADFYAPGDGKTIYCKKI